MRNRIVLLVILTAAGLSGLWFSFRPAVVTTVTPTRGDAAEVVYATGVVEPENWAKVSPLIRHRIIEVCDCEGRGVDKGTVLARLDDTEERAALSELQARQELARAELDRVTRLLERNVVSRQEVDRARTEVAQIEALLAGQEARLASLVLRSPVEGIVLREDAEVGEIADTSEVLYWVGEPKPLVITAEVNEEDIPRVAVDQKVLIKADAFPGRDLAGTLERVTPKGDPVTKTFRVRIALPEDTPLRIGMTVEINIVVRVSAGVLLVPSAAVQDEALFVVTGGRVERREVETGIRGETGLEIRTGLSGSESVVTPFPAELHDGDRVRETDP